MFQYQAQPGAFDTGAEDQLAWDEIRYNDILATVEGAPQQADELAASQMTQLPPVLTQPSQLAAGGAIPAAGRASPVGSRATPAGDGASPTGDGATPTDRATPNAAGSS
jgi:hypothetical protein